MEHVMARQEVYMKFTIRVVLLFVLCVVLVAPALAEDMNGIPMYGEKPRSPELLKADQDFIEKMIQTAGSREKAAHKLLLKGWEYIDKRDPQTAIKRFNQAWLLTPESGYVYWGFGAAVGSQGNFDEAIKFFQKADGLLPNNARLLCDIGFAYMWKGKSQENSRDTANVNYDKAISLFKRSSSLDPTYERTFLNWAIVLFFKGDYAGAWEKVARAEGLGGKTIDQTFIDELSGKLKRP
jgi:tetratricopeptide (TPR) repeat protein